MKREEVGRDSGSMDPFCVCATRNEKKMLPTKSRHTLGDNAKQGKKKSNLQSMYFPTV